MNKIALKIFISSLTFLLSNQALAEEAKELSIERIHDSPSLSGAPPRNMKISPDGQRVTFIRGKVNDLERYDLWEYHIESGETRLLFDADDLHKGNENLSDEEKARRERMRIYGSGILNYEWSSDGKALVFPLAGDVYYFKLGSESAKKIVETPEFETDVKFSPKGNYVSYVRNQNLFIYDLNASKETAITTKGGGDIKFAMAEFVAQEEMSRMSGYWWSPDEKHIALTKIDESPVMNITRSEIYADSIKMIEQKYPMAGSDNVLIELGVTPINKPKISWIDLGDNKDIYLARVDWKNNTELSYQVQSRDQKSLELAAYDLATQKQRSLLTESSDTWINLHFDLKFLDNGDFIWASERDGFKHLYLFDNKGELKKQLTKGNWVVDSIKAFDKNSQTLYFQARKDTVLESHLYALDLTSGKTTRLSEKGYYHRTTFSKDASVFVDSSSNVNTPPRVSLHKANGEQLTWLHENKVDKDHPLYPYMQSWTKPSFGTIKTEDDGTELHYRLYTPDNTDTKRPAIVYLYGGPIAQVVANTWGGTRGLMFQHWVDKGYVVFSIDNRGSNNRGKAFEAPIYRAMGDIEVKDQVQGVKFLHTLEYVDPERIGVYGHSYGGYMTLMTMFKAGEYFSAGVSGAPVTDWRLYDTHYTERYMGDPRELDAEYTASSVFPYAENLKGDLLILHGMADDNVLFSHSTKLYKHLQDRAIPFYIMDYPGKKHSLRSKQTGIHMFKTITNFFDLHLQ